MFRTVGAVKITDELEHFVKSASVPVDSPIKWWLENQQHRLYPSLSRIQKTLKF